MTQEFLLYFHFLFSIWDSGGVLQLVIAYKIYCLFHYSLVYPTDHIEFDNHPELFLVGTELKRRAGLQKILFSAVQSEIPFNIPTHRSDLLVAE